MSAPKKPAARGKKAAKRPAKKASGLATRGRRLWVALHDKVDGERGLVLLEEACRIADRLDKLDALLKGDADVWCRLVVDINGDGSVYELRVSSALIEARQQANTLRQLVASLPLKEAAGDGDDDEDDWVNGGAAPVLDPSEI